MSLSAYNFAQVNTMGNDEDERTRLVVGNKETRIY